MGTAVGIHNVGALSPPYPSTKLTLVADWTTMIEQGGEMGRAHRYILGKAKLFNLDNDELVIVDIE